MKTWWLLVVAYDLLMGNAFAQAPWPLALDGPPGYQLTDPVLARGDFGCVLVAARVTVTSADVHVFCVGSDGSIGWTGAYEAPNPQYVRAVAADGSGGALVIMEDQPVFPPTRNRLLLARFDDQGALQYAVPFADTLDGGRANPKLWLIGNLAYAIWADGRPDSSGIWWQVFDVSSGQPVHSSYGQRVNESLTYGMLGSGSDLYAYAGDQLFCVSGDSFWVIGTGTPLVTASLVSLGDSLVVAGMQSNGTALMQCFAAGALQWIDTVASISGWPHEVNLADHQDGLVVTYRSSSDLFYRCYSPSSGLGEASVVCDAPGEQYAHQTLATGASTALVVWYDTRDSHEVYLQHLIGNQQEWANGIRLSALTLSGEFPPLDACLGDSSGWISWSYNGQVYIQPGDTSYATVASDPAPAMPSNFAFYPAFPNPFNGSTELRFQLGRPGEVTVAAYNLLGQRVEVIRSGWMAAGTHAVRWSPTAASGTYLVRLQSAEASAAQTVTYLK